MTSTALTERPNGALSAAEQPGESGFTPKQINLLRQTIAKDCSDQEIALFVQFCKAKGLDPFAREVYAIKRGDSPMAIQISIDGLRGKAAASGLYDGQDPPVWYDGEGREYSVWLKPEPPAACKVSVYVKGMGRPATAIALYTEYVQMAWDKKTGEQRPNPIWAKMPANQLRKCAEALALRMALPKPLGGLYIAEELREEPQDPTPNGTDPIGSPAVLAIDAEAREAAEAEFGEEFDYPGEEAAPADAQDAPAADSGASDGEATSRFDSPPSEPAAPATRAQGPEYRPAFLGEELADPAKAAAFEAFVRGQGLDPAAVLKHFAAAAWTDIKLPKAEVLQALNELVKNSRTAKAQR